MLHRIIILSHVVVYIVNKKIRKNKMPVLKSTHLILTDSFKNSAWTLQKSRRVKRRVQAGKI
jgi:hypothetical protein